MVRGAEALEDRRLLSGNSNSIVLGAGDVDANGATDLFSALNSYGNAQIFRSEDGTGVGTPIYGSANNDEWTVRAVASGDVDNDGVDELFTAFERSDGGAYIYRSDTGESIGRRIYLSATAGSFTVQALAVGDADGDGDAELYSAFEHSSGVAMIYRSDSGNSIGSRIYRSASPHNFTVQALALGDVDEDGKDELFSAFEHSSGEARIYRSDSGTGIGSRIYTSASPHKFTIQALAAGDVDGDGADELFSAFQHESGYAYIYRSDGGNSIGNRIYKSEFSGMFTVSSLAAADVDKDGRDEFFSAFEQDDGSALVYRSDSGNSIGSRFHVEEFASRHLFLDFNGGTTDPGISGFSNVTTPAFDFDGTPGLSYDDFEFIEQIRDHVQEDFAPFKINITTVKPAYGTVDTVMIGGTSFRGTGESGVGKLNAFNPGWWWWNSRNPVYVFSQSISTAGPSANFAARIGTTISHEAGHGFGLSHKNEVDSNGNARDLDGDGVIQLGNGNDAYSPGDGNFTPIMGANQSTDRTIWTQDNVNFAPNRFLNGNNDFQHLASKLGFRRDDYVAPHAFGAMGPSSGHVRTGLIHNTQDVDTFTFVIGTNYGGDLNVSVDVNVAAVGANLDSTLTILDASGQTVATTSPSANLGASLSLSRLAAGTYSIVVGSAARFTGDVGGYSVRLSTSSVLPPVIYGDLVMQGGGDYSTGGIFGSSTKGQLTLAQTQPPAQLTSSYDTGYAMAGSEDHSDALTNGTSAATRTRQPTSAVRSGFGGLRSMFS